MKQTLIVLTFFLLITAGCSDSTGIDNNDNPTYQATAYLFDDTLVRDVRVTISGDAFTNVVLGNYVTNIGSDERVYALAASIEVDGEIVSNIGIRTRGNTSENNDKRQFKISFDAQRPYTNASPDGFVYLPENDPRRFHGVKKINLRASQNDPTIIREKVASHIYEKAGCPASRVGFARVFINGEYWGLYLITEQIDKTFLQSRFSEKSGNLYKSAYGPFTGTGEDSFELKTNTELNDRTDLVSWSQSIQNTSVDSEIGSYVDVDNIIAYMAATVLVGHWDSFLGNYNNDYLYHHSDGRFRIITWDLDNTFGSDWVWNTLPPSIYSWNSGSDTNWDVLFSKIMAVPVWKTQYTEKLQYLLANFYNAAYLHAKIDQWKALIETAALADERKNLDKGYDSATGNTVWQESFTERPSAGSWAYYYCTGGLKGYITEKAANIQNEIDNGTVVDTVTLTVDPATPRIDGMYYGIDLRTSTLNLTVNGSSVYGISGAAVQSGYGTGYPWTIVGIDASSPYSFSVIPPVMDWQQFRAVITNGQNTASYSAESEWIFFYRSSAKFTSPVINGGNVTFYADPADISPYANSTNVYITGTFTSPTWMSDETYYSNYSAYRLTNAAIGDGVLCITLPASSGGEYKFLVDVNNDGIKDNSDWFRDPSNPRVSPDNFDNNIIP